MMKFSFLYSLRSRATGLVLLAVLPLLVLILYSYYDQREQAIREVQEDELVAVRNMAHSQEAVFNTLRQLLTTLARLPEVQSHDIEACNALFAELLKLSPHSVSIVATDAEGRLFASAPAVSGMVNYSDRSWFKKIMQTRDLVMGEIIVGRISGKCGNNLAYPILDKEGRFLGGLSFHLNLDWVGELLAESKFPPTTAIALSDSSRKVLFRYPHPEKFLGRMLPEALIKPMAVSNEGVAEGVGLPGDPRLFAFARLSPPWQEMWMLIGLPRDSAMAPAKRNLERNLIFLGLIAVFSLTATWSFGKFLIDRPVGELIRVTQQLAAGDLTVRVGSDCQKGELGLLAGSFDQMAASLQEREEAVQAAHINLINEKNRLEAVLEALPVGVSIINEQGGLIQCNEMFDKVWGGPRPLPRNASDYQAYKAWWLDTGKQVQPEEWAAAQAVRQGKAIIGQMMEIERFDGERRYVINSGAPIRYADGRITGSAVAIFDITEQRRTHEALRVSEERLRLALESANAGIWQWDSQTKNDFWSDELWKLYGLEPHSSKPSYDTWRQTVFPADLPEVEHKLQEAASKGTKFNAEWRIYIPDAGERWILSRGRPYLDANGQISSYLGISLDITERKQAEQELQESRERLHLLANQLLTSQEQERKRLALELHDELGHALLILKFSLRDIAQKLPPEQGDVKYLLQEQLEYIKHVIQNVRRLYRDLSPGDLENLGLTRALKSLIEDFAGHLPDITWQVNLPKLTGRFSLPVQTMIYRLVQEALTNIGKHAEPSQVSISAREENGRLCLVIEDDGHGFDLSEVERDPARGLGLAAMRERLYILGGSLEIRSQKGQGTRLTFTIPTLPKGA